MADLRRRSRGSIEPLECFPQVRGQFLDCPTLALELGLHDVDDGAETRLLAPIPKLRRQCVDRHSIVPNGIMEFINALLDRSFESPRIPAAHLVSIDSWTASGPSRFCVALYT